MRAAEFSAQSNSNYENGKLYIPSVEQPDSFIELLIQGFEIVRLDIHIQLGCKKAGAMILHLTSRIDATAPSEI